MVINKEMSIELEKVKNNGVFLLKWRKNLKAGFYEYMFNFSNPGKPLLLRLLVNGREVGKYRVYHEVEASQKITSHPFRFFLEKDGNCHFCIELMLSLSLKSAELVLKKALLKSLTYPLPCVWEKEFPGKVMLDMWGWHVSPFYVRTMTVGPDFFKRKVIKESQGWGANFVQIHPYTIFINDNYGRCKNLWNEDNIKQFIIFCHRKGIFYEEHGFPPVFSSSNCYRAEKTYEQIGTWMRQNADCLKYKREEIADGFEIEEYTDYDYKGALHGGRDTAPGGCDGIFTSDFRTKALSAFLWNFNPGAYISIATGIPNEECAREKIPAYNDVYQLERGPNFVFVHCNGGFGNDDIYSVRLFPDQSGFHNPSARIFIGFQSDSRPFAWHSVYGGRNYPDWFLEESNHFFRPRWKEKQSCESAIYWLGDGDAVLPEEVRDYVYIVSMDPIRASVTANLTTTGLGGFLRNISDVGLSGKVKSGIGAGNKRKSFLFFLKELNSEYRVNYPSDSSFIQNRFFRIYNGAHGGCSVEYDIQNIAQFSSHGAKAYLFNNCLTTKWVRTDMGERIELNKASAGEYRIRLEEGSYILKVDTNKIFEVPVNVYLEGRHIARLESGNNRRKWQIFFSVYGDEERNIVFLNDNKEAPDVSCYLEKNILTRTSLWSIGDRYGRSCPFHGQNNVDQINCNIEEDPLEIIPLSFGGKEKSITLIFKGEGTGCYDLVLGVRAVKDAKIRVSVNQFSFLKNNERKRKGVDINGDFSDKKYGIDPSLIPWSGQSGITADNNWHQISFPISLITHDTNHITIYCEEGELEFSGIELMRTPVKHLHALPGGNKAILEEYSVRNYKNLKMNELFRWEVVNDSPVFACEIVRKLEKRSGSGENIITSLDLGLYTDIEVNGKNFKTGEVLSEPISDLRLIDRREVLPAVVFHFLKKGKIYQVKRTQTDLEFISRITDKEEIKVRIYIGFEIYKKKLNVFNIYHNSEIELCFGKKDKIVIPNRKKRSIVSLLKITDPQKRGYWIKENGWWHHRGAQLVTDYLKSKQHISKYNKWVVKGDGKARVPVKEPDSAYLKIYCGGKGDIVIQRSEYINNMVRPIPGCQYLMALKDVEKDGCIARVMNTTAYLFAPGIEWNKPFTQVWLNGKLWHYFDERVIYLPQRPGKYLIKISDDRETTPSISRTAACVKKTSWKNGELSIETCLPDYVKKLPSGLYYRAMISYDRSRFVVNELSGCVLERPGELGDIISFKPGKFKISFLEIKT